MRSNRYILIADQLWRSTLEAIWKMESLVVLLSLLSSIQIEFERPADARHGDYATNVALRLFRELSSEQKHQVVSPRQLAQEIVAKTELPSQLVAKVEVAGPGFINFTLAEHYLLEELNAILTKSDQLAPQVHAGKKLGRFHRS